MAEKKQAEEPGQDDIGPLDPSLWEEQPSVTGRPADQPTGNSTFAARAKAAKPAATKAVDEDAVENKAVRSTAARKK